MEMKIVIQVPESVEALIKTMLKGSPARVEIAGVESPDAPQPEPEAPKRRGRPKKSEQTVANDVESPSPSTPQSQAAPMESPTGASTANTPPAESEGPTLDSIRDLVLKTNNGIELSKTILNRMGVQKIGELSPEQRVDFVTQLGML